VLVTLAMPLSHARFNPPPATPVSAAALQLLRRYLPLLRLLEVRPTGRWANPPPGLSFEDALRSLDVPLAQALREASAAAKRGAEADDGEFRCALDGALSAAQGAVPAMKLTPGTVEIYAGGYGVQLGGGAGERQRVLDHVALVAAMDAGRMRWGRRASWLEAGGAALRCP
jgi:hypothetical protein